MTQFCDHYRFRYFILAFGVTKQFSAITALIVRFITVFGACHSFTGNRCQIMWFNLKCNVNSYILGRHRKCRSGYGFSIDFNGIQFITNAGSNSYSDLISKVSHILRHGSSTVFTVTDSNGVIFFNESRCYLDVVDWHQERVVFKCYFIFLCIYYFNWIKFVSFIRSYN